MRIRTKLAAGFMGIAAAATAAAGASFLSLQDRTYKSLQIHGERSIMADAVRSAGEADFAQDPLMLLDDLSFMIKHHPEIAWARVIRNGHAARLDPKEPRESKDVLVERTGYASKSRGSADGSVAIEIAFSKPYLEDQRLKARQRALSDMLQAAYAVLPLALLLAFGLSYPLSRRLEALESTLEEIGQGKLGAQTEVGGKDEIGKLAAEINAMSRKLGELEAMKKTFIASVTHELRSPLAAVESSVRLILSQPGNRAPAELDMLRRIQSSAARLGHFVTNLLEMAKIERGKLEMHAQQVPVKSLVEDAVLFFEPRAKEAGLTLSLGANGDLPARMKADPDLITQVLTNLISNAIKFTPSGGRVEVDVNRLEDEGRPWLECAVKDTGPGIPKEALGRLFAPFERIPNATRAGGAGLGLAISKAIVEMHGGRIGAESVHGRGSRFFFRLPL